MQLCDYGCGQEANYTLKNGKGCCQSHYLKCPVNREKRKKEGNPFFKKHHSDETKELIKRKMQGERNPRYGKVCSEETKEKISISLKGKMIKNKNPFYKKKHTCESKKLMSVSLNYKIDDYKEKYPLFSKIEEMRYNPDKPGEKEIQVHCKNHNCQNSKEKAGWFTPTKIQLSERIRQIEYGNGGSYFYCSDECKNICPLYRLRSDPFSNSEKSYTDEEYNIFRQTVLKRDNNICQYCGNIAEHAHHERPQKLEPFFSLDLDLAWSVCKVCHYKYAHKDECSTGQLANKICI